MTLTEKQAVELRASTFDAASVLLDDLSYIRELVAKQAPSAGDIRRVSAQLRRILVERGLTMVAAPRVGRVHLMTQHLTPVHRSNRSKPIDFFASAGASLFGVYIAAAMVEGSANTARDLAGYSPNTMVALKLDGFLNQEVICLGGEWASRADVIKYIANVAHGVHSGIIRESRERLIHRARHAAFVRLEAGVPQLAFNHNAFSNVVLPPVIKHDRIDYALIEILATATYLINSPDVQNLEKVIRDEVGA